MGLLVVMSISTTCSFFSRRCRDTWIW